ncbi:YihY/virulence factor BrkB family protein [Streptomyces sp. SM12]|uniref:YihY/virulence factor BrkB family protein n=1 Tax=unclassified Streptomyces TaxID=2593676 RepID=UPI000CD50769
MTADDPSRTGDDEPEPDRPRAALYHRIPKAKLLWLLLKDTVQSCAEHRIVGMAAEAAFFTLLSLPPLLLGLIGLLSSLDAVAGTDTLETVRFHILDISTTMLSERGVEDVVRPLIDDLTQGARPDVMSFGFIVALWSGSRAVNVFVGTITVMYGMEGYRNPAATRLLAFLMYLVSLVVGAVVVPAMVIGPELAIGWFPGLEGQLRVLYWPVVLLLCVGFLTTLYHVSVPVRSPWREDIPGAMVALAIWALCAFALRAYLRTTVEGQSMYGSLAVPVAILMWLGMSAFAVLVGAALNAAVDRVWPTAATAAARAETDEARAAAAEAMLAAVRERRSRAEKLGIQAYDMTATAMRLAGTLRPSDLKQQLKEARQRRRRDSKARRELP